MYPKLYPNSTGDGEAIPLDIIRPTGSLTLSINPTTSSAAMQLPADTEVFTVLSKVDCQIQFGGVGITAADYVDGVVRGFSIFIPANVLITISPPSTATHFAAISIVANGSLFVQYLETWNALNTASKFARR